MTNQEKALQILNEKDELGALRMGSLAESVAISCIVKALNEKDAKFKEFLEKKLVDIDDRVCFSSGRIMYDEDKVAVACIIREIINELFKE